MGKIYQVEASGHAPKGVAPGDYVQTAGGLYQVLDSTKYKGMTNEQLAQAGVGYNPATGLYSKKVSDAGSGTVQPTYTQFDSEAWKDNYIKAQLAALDKNYAISNANLTKTFYNNKAQFGDHIIDVKKAYDQSISQLEQDAYRGNIMAKQQASSQGLTSSGQGIALAQSVLNNANESAVALWKSREESINKIQNAINQLSANYNIDRDALLSAYNADKLAIMSNAEIQALEQKLKVDMTNAGLKNQWDMMEYQIKNENEWRAKELELAYKQLAASMRGGGGRNENPINPEYESYLVDTYHKHLNNVRGEDWYDNLPPSARYEIDKARGAVAAGLMTFEDYQKIVQDALNSASKSQKQLALGDRGHSSKSTSISPPVNLGSAGFTPWAGSDVSLPPGSLGAIPNPLKAFWDFNPADYIANLLRIDELGR